MQRSANANKVQVLISRFQTNVDISDATVYMQYALPSKRILGMFLTPNDINYKSKDYLQYVIPMNTMLTSEAGNIEITFSFYKLHLDENNIQKEFVIKTKGGYIEITPILPWAEYIPDEQLMSIDQRILAMEAIQKNQDALNQEMFESMAHDLVLDETQKRLLLLSKTGTVGAGISIDKLSDVNSTNLR